jgi:hypothetical protein
VTGENNRRPRIARVIRGAFAAGVVMVSLTSAARAQGTTGGGQFRTMRTAVDSAKAKKDSLKNLPLVTWAPADSVAESLMRRDGYSLVRYSATDVRFGAKDRTIYLLGNKDARAAVQRDQTVLVADTIEYTDTSSTVVAIGHIVMREPKQNDDLFATAMTYNMVDREGKAKTVATSTKSGQTWYVSAKTSAFASDSTSKFYGLDGTITSCDDSLPHYYFRATEIKGVTGSIVVARPAVLYIQGVPILWLPFIFQDNRDGRRSGVLTPSFGITELLRNSPQYRRTVENVGYYFALSDYYDAAISMDWRSSAKATLDDPGWVRLNSELRYRWLNRFLSGRLAVSNQSLSSGNSNLSLSWTHQQDFSIHSHLTMGLNYVSSTTIQRQTTINPLAAVATIASQANFQQEMGPVSMSLGGTRRQYPGRKQVDQDLPSLNFTSKPINLAKWLLWTPSLQLQSSQSLHIDGQGDFTKNYTLKADGTLDSTALNRSSSSSSMSLNTPFKIGEFVITAAVRAQDIEHNFPEKRIIVDPVDTSKRSTRVYARTYLTTVDYDVSMALPQILQGHWNLTPSISVANIDPGAYFVRSERTGTRWVAQGKRLSYGLGISPTVYGFFPGFGAVSKFRHTITTNVGYSYSPAANVSTDYLAALGRTQTGYLGSLAQNRVTLTLSQSIEAKLKMGGDSANTNPEAARKIKVLSLNFTPLTYDFERLRVTHKTGFATDNFGVTLSSELLPGFDYGMDYSLFNGSVLSDTAKFSPYLTNIRANFSLDKQSGLVQFIGRLFGAKAPVRPVRDTTRVPSLADRTGYQNGDSSTTRLGGAESVAAPGLRISPLEVPMGQGFTASFGFTKTQQRPPTGGNVIQFDPTLQCLPYKDVNPVQYQICVQNALLTPILPETGAQTTAGGSFFRVPPQTNITTRMAFNLTPKWGAAWSTNYDVERAEFGSQTVALTRDLHDWTATFGFTQAPNGNFSFTFNIRLKAETSVKFDYNRATYRQTGTSLTQ